MPVVLSLPNVSLISKRPSPSASRSATTPPPVGGLPAVRSATYTSPFGAATRCRAGPSPSAPSEAQKPDGSERPALSGSHAGVEAAPFSRAASSPAPHPAATIAYVTCLNEGIVPLFALGCPCACAPASPLHQCQIGGAHA